MRLVSAVLLCACLLAAAVSASQAHQQGEPACRDFAGRSGTCGDIRLCPDLFRLIDGGRRPSSAEIANLRRSVCSSTGNRIHLCCAHSPDRHPNRAIVERGKLCGTNLHSRIRGGEPVRLGEYPWVALLGYTSLTTGAVSFECGGSLIGLQYVLTAAHCVVDLPGGFQLTSVRLGEHDLSRRTDCQVLIDGTTICNEPQNFNVSKAFVHESYNRPRLRDNDIALLRLDRPVVEDDFVGKVCLPFDMARLRDYTDVNMTAAGFGRVGPNRNSPASSVLLKVDLLGVDQRECRRTIRDQGGSLSRRQLCAGGERGRDSCGGDSGGPLVAATPIGPPYSLVGVISFGARRCGEGEIPSVNTRVSEYLNWILDRVDV